MSDYEKILKATAFKNADRFAGNEPLAGGKPNFSNNSLTLHTAIPAGTYSLGIWQYSDSGNLSVSLTTKPAQAASQDAAPAQDLGDLADDFS
mgnify:CR=1 FL=1